MLIRVVLVLVGYEMKSHIFTSLSHIMTFKFSPVFHYYTACCSEHHVPIYARVCFLGQTPETGDAGS